MRIKLYSLIIFLNSFSMGLIVPVLSLALMDKGATLSNISVIMGIYSLTVVVSELPTGILADLIGRKKIFCISLFISLIGFLIILVGNGMLVLCIGIIMYGLSRALSSGSFESMFIDSYIDVNGKDKLHKITTRLSVLDALGLSAGALAGGFIPKISIKLLLNIGKYDLNLIVKILLTIIITVLSIVFIKENSKSESKISTSLKDIIKDSSSVVMKNETLKCILISSFSTGFFLLSLETYWQPHFINLLPDNNMIWLLGFITFIYFAACILGNVISEKIIDKYKFDIKKIYFITRLLLAFLIIIMSLQVNVPFFIASYSLVYLLLGMSNVPESVILNGEIPNEIRASSLSLNSLIVQLGGLCGSLTNSIIINYISIPSLWVISAVIILITLVFIFKKFIFNKKCNVSQ